MSVKFIPLLAMIFCFVLFHCVPLILARVCATYKGNCGFQIGLFFLAWSRHVYIWKKKPWPFLVHSWDAVWPLILLPDELIFIRLVLVFLHKRTPFAQLECMLQIMPAIAFSLIRCNFTPCKTHYHFLSTRHRVLWQQHSPRCLVKSSKEHLQAHERSSFISFRQ